MGKNNGKNRFGYKHRFMSGSATLRGLSPSSGNFRNAVKTGLGLGLVSGSAGAGIGTALAQKHAKHMHEANLSKAKAVSAKVSAKAGEHNAKIASLIDALRQEISDVAKSNGLSISIGEIHAKGNKDTADLIVGIDGPDRGAAARLASP